MKVKQKFIVTIVAVITLTFSLHINSSAQTVSEIDKEISELEKQQNELNSKNNEKAKEKALEPFQKIWSTLGPSYYA